VRAEVTSTTLICPIDTIKLIDYQNRT
jgi:hypothetical protein